MQSPNQYGFDFAGERELILRRLGWSSVLFASQYECVTAPIRLVAIVLQNFVPLFRDGTWATLTTPGAENYHALWAPLLIFEMVGNLGFAISYTVLAFLFFGKSRNFPKTYIAIALVNLCFVVLDTWFAALVLPDQPMLDPDTTKEIASSLVGVTIWVPYMLVSKRVRNTFVV